MVNTSENSVSHEIGKLVIHGLVKMLMEVARIAVFVTTFTIAMVIKWSIYLCVALVATAFLNR